MQTHINHAILRRSAVFAATGQSQTTLYRHIGQGLFPRPVRLGERSVGWPSHEIEGVMAARIAGQSDSDIRELVCRMHKARTPDGKEPSYQPVLRPIRPTAVTSAKGGAQS
jgi:prophage regulatory protein